MNPASLNAIIRNSHDKYTQLPNFYETLAEYHGAFEIDEDPADYYRNTPLKGVRIA